MKSIFLVSVVLLTLLIFLSCIKPKNVYNYKYAKCDGLLTKTGVYLDSLKVGEIKSIDLLQSANYCYGKIEFTGEFKVYSDMEFSCKESLVGNSLVQVSVVERQTKKLLNPETDTLIILDVVGLR